MGAAIILVGGAIVVAPAFRESPETAPSSSTGATAFPWHFPRSTRSGGSPIRRSMFYIHAVRVMLPAPVRLLAVPGAVPHRPARRSERPRRRSSPTPSSSPWARRVPHVATRARVLNNFILNTSGIVVLKLGEARHVHSTTPCSLPFDAGLWGPFLGQYQEPIRRRRSSVWPSSSSASACTNQMISAGRCRYAASRVPRSRCAGGASTSASRTPSRRGGAMSMLINQPAFHEQSSCRS